MALEWSDLVWEQPPSSLSFSMGAYGTELVCRAQCTGPDTERSWSWTRTTPSPLTSLPCAGAAEAWAQHVMYVPYVLQDLCTRG